MLISVSRSPVGGFASPPGCFVHFTLRPPCRASLGFGHSAINLFPGAGVPRANRNSSPFPAPPTTPYARFTRIPLPCVVSRVSRVPGCPAPYDTPPGFGCVPVTGGFPGQVVGLQKSAPFRCFSSQTVEKRNIFATIQVKSTKTTSKRCFFATLLPGNSTNFFMHIDRKSRKWYYKRAEDVGLCLTTLYCYQYPAQGYT